MVEHERQDELLDQTEERVFDGHNMTELELDAILRIIKQANVEAVIEDGDIVIQAVQDVDDHVISIARCDLRRLAAYSAIIARQDEGDSGVFALAGLFSKCAQIVLNEAEPRYAEAEDEDGESLGCTVRLFAGNDRKNPPEPLHAV